MVISQERLIKLILELRNSGVSDTEVLSAIENIPRDKFVEKPFLDQAWMDKALPISCGQTISQPLVVALMTQALDTRKSHKVLEVGTGSGYQTAILSLLVKRVYTIERHAELLIQAEKRFNDISLNNIRTLKADGNHGWPLQAPFDRIIVTAAAPIVPETLISQLSNEDGIMVLPVGDHQSMEQMMIKITKKNEKLHSEQLFPVRFVPLVEGVPR